MRFTDMNDQKGYDKLLGAVKKRHGALTAADVVAATALPLEKVKELLPALADEYSARLRVTESGEIVYNFPRHLKSKHKGAAVFVRRAFRAVLGGLKKLSVAVFKVWIMLMLVGYFVLFMLIALAALALSFAANRSSDRDSGGGGGFFAFSGILNLIIRIWFYSELTRSLNESYYGTPRRGTARPKGKPLFKAVFSFVFGDGDPNAGMETREKQAFIAYVQAAGGVISLPEFMTLTGLPPLEADEKILSYCAQFGGSPEATEQGTVVYTFKDLLLRADTADRSFKGCSAPLRRLRFFSSNEKKMNVYFGVINTVNLLFGSYFFYNALTTGAILTQQALNAASKLYGLSYYLLFSLLHINPLPVLLYGLGVVPLVFSLLFWIIPGLRFLALKKENQLIKTRNLRKTGYKTVLDKRRRVCASDISAQAEACSPDNLPAAKERILTELGTYSMPAVSIGEKGEAVYAFEELDGEMAALEQYRAKERKNAARLGGVVFDTGE